MGPQDVDVIRAYARNVGAATGDNAFTKTAPFEIVVEAEAGNQIWGGGGQFEVGVVLRDLTACNTLAVPAPVANTPVSGANANYGALAWPAAGPQTFVYTVPIATIVGLEDHILQVLAWLRSGIATPDVSFCESPEFIITM
jgi:hypothetical protein